MPKLFSLIVQSKNKKKSMGGLFSNGKGSDEISFHELENKKTIVFIEGNISSGKSTLISNLKNLGYPVWQEAVDRLTQEYLDKDGNNLLELFYKDMKSYAFKLQIASLGARWKIIKEALDFLYEKEDNCDETRTEEGKFQDKIKEDIVFIERSNLTDVHSFAKNLRESEHIDALEWGIYTSHLKEHLKDIGPHFGTSNIIFLYLQTDPEACMKRKNERARKEEDSVTMEYLKSLHDKHEEWLNNDKDDTFSALIINGNDDKETVVYNVVEKVGNLHLADEPVMTIQNLTDIMLKKLSREK